MAYGLILKLTNNSSNKLLLDDIFPSGIPEWQKQKLFGGSGMPAYLGASSTMELPFADFVQLSYSSGKIRALIAAGTVSAEFKSSSDYVSQSAVMVVGNKATDLANVTNVISIPMPNKGTITSIKLSLAVKTAFAGTAVFTAGNMTGNVNLLGAASYDVLAAGATQLTAGTAVSIPLSAVAGALTVAAGSVIRLQLVSNNAGLDIAGLSAEVRYTLG